MKVDSRLMQVRFIEIDQVLAKKIRLDTDLVDCNEDVNLHNLFAGAGATYSLLTTNSVWTHPDTGVICLCDFI